VEEECTGNSFSPLEGRGKVLIIDHPEKSRKPQIVSQNFVNLVCEGWRCLLQRFPFGQDNGNLDEGGGIDIEVNPCSCRREKDKP
jgi:hypothetical protein